MALKPCLVCGALSSQSRCSAHQLRSGSTRAWREKRERILARDGYRCTWVTDTGRCTSTSDLHVDHLVPLAAGGGDADSNLTTLCARHNLAKGAR